MESIFGEGVLSSVLEWLDPALRPLIENIVVAAIVVAAFAAALDRILNFLDRIGRMLAAAAKWLVGIFKKRKPQEPPPDPGRTIPDELTIWEARAGGAAATLPNAKGIPIITVAAMKGGVGKTTIAANLAVYFQRARQKPVLVIDFDYQGSLSECLRGQSGMTDRDLTCDILLRRDGEFQSPELYAREMRNGLEDIYLYPTDYPFATIENNMMIQWVRAADAADSTHNDLMYRLCKQLKKPAFQLKFCAIVIDSPPRLTTGSINALCASTHLLVPTTLDDMSAQAAEYFLGQVDRMQNSDHPLFPKLKVIGIVPSIVSADSTLQVHEQRALDRLKAFGEKSWNRSDFVLEESRVPRRAEIARAAGLGVAYLRNRANALIFDRLGKAVDERL